MVAGLEKATWGGERRDRDGPIGGGQRLRTLLGYSGTNSKLQVAILRLHVGGCQVGYRCRDRLLLRDASRCSSDGRAIRTNSEGSQREANDVTK
jgi:hypothetical protein